MLQFDIACIEYSFVILQTLVLCKKKRNFMSFLNIRIEIILFIEVRSCENVKAKKG